MNWQFWKRKPKDVIPNPRDSKRKKDAFEVAQKNVLLTAQFLCFTLAILILLQVS